MCLPSEAHVALHTVDDFGDLSLRLSLTILGGRGGRRR